MVVAVIVIGAVQIALFVFLYDKIRELRSNVDTLTSQIYGIHKDTQNFYKLCMSRHSTSKGVDYPNSRR